jgi:hypothetical protein
MVLSRHVMPQIGPRPIITMHDYMSPFLRKSLVCVICVTLMRWFSSSCLYAAAGSGTSTQTALESGRCVNVASTQNSRAVLLRAEPYSGPPRWPTRLICRAKHSLDAGRHIHAIRAVEIGKIHLETPSPQRLCHPIGKNSLSKRSFRLLSIWRNQSLSAIAS